MNTPGNPDLQANAQSAGVHVGQAILAGNPYGHLVGMAGAGGAVTYGYQGGPAVSHYQGTFAGIQNAGHSPYPATPGPAHMPTPAPSMVSYDSYQSLMNVQHGMHTPIHTTPASAPPAPQHAVAPPRVPYPAMQPCPAPPQSAYSFAAKTKLSGDNVFREFVLIQNHITILEHQVSTLIHQNNWAYNRVTQLEQMLITRESVSEEIAKAIREAKVQASNDDESSGEDESDGSDSESEEKTESELAAASNPILELVRLMLRRFIGVQKLEKREDFPVYVEGEAAEDVPLVEGSDEAKQIRFNWEEDYNDEVNHTGLATITKFAQSHGGEYLSGASQILPKIVYGDLLDKFEDHFMYLRRKFRGKTGKKAKADPEVLTTTDRRNRGRAKFNKRLLKRSKLEPDAEARDRKYDGLFSSIRHMSPDYVVPTDKTVFESRAEWHRSAKVQEILDAIDAVDDPSPDPRYLTRVRREINAPGPEDDQSRPKEYLKAPDGCLKNGRVRGADLRPELWMVDPEWLEKHKKCCDNDRKIKENPAGWGVGEDSSAVDERYADMRAQKDVQNELKKRKRASSSKGAKNGGKEKKGKGNKKAKKAKGKGKEKAVEEDDYEVDD